MLVLAFVLAAAGAPATPIRAHQMHANAPRIPPDLYSQAADVSGALLCSQSAAMRRIKARRNARFDRVYGKRFNRLVQAMVAKDGIRWPADFVFVDGCYRPGDAATARRAFRAFDDVLKTLEAQYGLSDNRAPSPGEAGPTKGASGSASEDHQHQNGNAPHAQRHCPPEPGRRGFRPTASVNKGVAKQLRDELEYSFDEKVHAGLLAPFG